MSIGYACKLIGVPNTDMKACTLKNASIEKLTELIKYNINSLCNIIDYNIENNIKLFRISSDIKCMNCTTPNLKISQLEEEWSKYKYTVLEKSHNKYLELREYLKNKNNISASIFYTLLQEALKSEGSKGSQVNSLLHVWKYFKNLASCKEREIFFRDLEKFEANQIRINIVKKHLKKLSEKYNSKYILNSYYFSI